ncbi:MAG TPA: phage tail protein, partial [Anaerolineae bacterium]|nr:phage tail protein [Anaerolineae bacterium]
MNFSKLSKIILIIGLLFPASTVFAAPTAQAYYVAPNGVYANAGTIDAPTTLEGARDKIRALNPKPTDGVIVYLRGGVYERSSTFTLSGAQDSGSSSGPIVYRAYPGETPRLSGGKQLDPTWFSVVTSGSPVWSRLAPAAQGNVQEVDL